MSVILKCWISHLREGPVHHRRAVDPQAFALEQVVLFPVAPAHINLASPSVWRAALEHPVPSHANAEILGRLTLPRRRLLLALESV